MQKRTIHRICLLNLKRYTWSKTPKIKNALDNLSSYLKAYYSPSLSLLTIAGLTPPQIEVIYIDEDFEDIDYTAGYDIVGISAMTQEALHAYEVAQKFRENGVYTVMGGIHASVMPDEASGFFDTVIIGEAEILWPKFLNDYINGNEKKLYHNEKGISIDLEHSPVPRYDLLKNKNYFKDTRYYYNMVPVQVSRGCPHDCEFCLVTSIYGKKYRKKSIDQIKQEINEIKKNLPGRIILFADDNLFVNRKFAKELLGAIKELDIRWWAQSDISIANDEELLDLIYESGGLFLLIGFESIDPENLKNMNKNAWKFKQLKDYEKNIEKIHKHGVIVFGSFIFGFDHDDTGVFEHVVKFMNTNHLTGQMTIATPLPGSRLYTKLQNENRLLYNDAFWDKCTFLDVLYQPKKMSVEELENGFIYAYNQIFNQDSFSKRSEYLKNIYKNIANK